MPRWGSGDYFLLSQADHTSLVSSGTITNFLRAGLELKLEALASAIDGKAPESFFAGATPLRYGHDCRISECGLVFQHRIEPRQANSQTSPEVILEAVFEAIQRIAPKSGDVAVALSGGIDSSLLIAAAVAGGWRDRMVGYIGNSPDGHDTHFAELAARSAGIRYIKVDLPYHEPDRDIISDLIALADSHGAPPPASGVSMVKIARTAKANGHNVLLHGQGGEMISTGLYGKKWSPALLQELMTKRRFGDALRLVQNPVARLRYRDLWSGFRGKLPRQGIAQFIVDSMSHQAAYRDFVRIRRNTRAGGILAASPFLDEKLEPFLLNDLEERFFRPVIKLPARKALEKVLSPEVAWRKDDQGLRWDPKKFFSANREAVEPLFRHLPEHAPAPHAKVNADYLRRLSAAAFIAALESCRASMKD